MSEGWGGDSIPQSLGNLVEALSAAQHLPHDAIDAAVRAPGRVAGAVIAAVHRAASGEDVAERERNLLFWGIHVLAQARDTRLFDPLLRLLRRPPDDVIALLGEAIDTTLPRILISTYGGDAAGLEGAIVDPSTEELARFGLFGTLSYLTFEGRIERARTEAALVRFDEERPVRAGNLAWAGWASAIALLGFVDLRDRVAAALQEARLLLDDESDPEWFDRILADAASRPSDASRFEEAGLGPVGDAVAELESALASDEEGEPGETVVNPLRHVGRNDPCPCGSGLKFKKCCLGRENEAA